MLIKKLHKKIALSIVACIAINQSLYGENQTNTLNTVIQNYSESNNKIDTSKYGDLSKYEIGGVSLEDFVQVKNTVNKKVEFINNGIDNLENLETTEQQDNKVENITNSIATSIQEYKNVEVENTRNPFIDNAIGAYDAIKTAPTLAKYGAKLVDPGVSKAYNNAKKVINTVDKVNGAAEVLSMNKALLNIIEPFITKGVSNIDDSDTSNLLEGMADIKASLDQMLNNPDSKTTLGAKGITTVYSLIESIDNSLVESKIQKNIDNMVNDGLMNENTASLVKAKMSNDAIANAANTYSKSIEVLSMLGVKNSVTDMAAEIVGDMNTIAEVFIKGADRINEQAFKDIYNGRVEQKEALVSIGNDILETTNILKDNIQIVDKNKETLTKIDDKNKELQAKLESISIEEESLKTSKQNLSETKNAMDRNKAIMNENKLTDKEKLLVEAQQILYSGGNKGVSMGVAFSGLSTVEKARLAEISKELGITNYDKLGNLITNTNITTLAMGMARYVLSNNTTISDLAVKQERYLNASSWYEEEKDTWSLIAKEIINITNEIEVLKEDIASLENDKSFLMSQIEDTSDYNDNTKSDLTTNSDTSNIPLTGYINASDSSLFTGISSGIVVTESSGTLDTLSLGVGSKPLLNEGTFTKKPDNDYSYITWGTWASTNVKYYTGDGSVYDLGQTNNTAYYGKRTPVNEIPTTGSAVYNGEAIGHILSTNAAVEGTVQILANFANSTVSGSINITGFANTNINNGQIGGIYTGSSAAYSKTIDGSLSGVDVSSGSMNAQFYGSGAAEMGGTWKIIKTDSEEASGVFRAKK